MSLKEFLAVGRSFAGSPRAKSPFEMRRDVRLPIFESEPRFSEKHPIAVQADWIEARKPVTATPPVKERAGSPGSTRGAAPGRAKRTWLAALTFGLLGKTQRSREWVQGEMNLENVRVIRNDLADSDLEVVVKKKKGFSLRPAKTPKAPKALNTSEPPILPARGNSSQGKREWSELTARLFEIGQH